MLPELEEGEDGLYWELDVFGLDEFCPPPKLDKKDAPVIGVFPVFGDVEPGWGAPALPDDIQDGWDG